MSDEFISYALDVWKWLDTLKIGDIKNTTNVSNPENFIKAIKLYIDVTDAIEFSGDYKKIRRIQTLWEYREEQLKLRNYENIKNSTKPGTDQA